MSGERVYPNWFLGHYHLAEREIQMKQLTYECYENSDFEKLTYLSNHGIADRYNSFLCPQKNQKRSGN